MAIDGGVRASRYDREATVEALRQAYVAGRLDLPELRERSGAAYSARTWGDLRRLVADLPGQAFGCGCRPVPASAAPSPPQLRRLPAGGTRPFAPLSVMAAAWLAIAVLSRADVAAIPLVLLALWALYAAGHRVPMRPPDRHDLTGGTSVSPSRRCGHAGRPAGSRGEAVPHPAHRGAARAVCPLARYRQLPSPGRPRHPERAESAGGGS